MATTPNFVETPKNWAVVVDTANTSLTNPTGGAYQTLATGAVGGTRIERINVRGLGATTAGMVRFFVVDSLGTAYLYHEIVVTVVSPGASTVAFNSEWARTDGQPVIDLEEAWLLIATTHNSESFSIVGVFGGDHGT